MNAEKSPFASRWSHGKPVRADGGKAPDDGVAVGATLVGCGGGGGGGGAAAAAPTFAANSVNCESGCQVAIPSRQPRSLGKNRPLGRPSRTCSSGNAPRPVAPRLTWIIAIAARF